MSSWLRRQGRLLSRFIINSVRRVAKAPLPAHTQRDRGAPPAAAPCWRLNSLLYQIGRSTHAPHLPHGTPTRGVRCSITTTPDYFKIYEERRKHWSACRFIHSTAKFIGYMFKLVMGTCLIRFIFSLALSYKYLLVYARFLGSSVLKYEQFPSNSKNILSWL